MTQIESQYFALLRAALWNTPVVFDGEIDWRGVVRLAQHHANDVLLSSVATQMSDDEGPSSEMRQQMKAAMRGNLIIQLHLKQILLPAVQLLRQHGIEPVLLKGFSLALLYPNSNLRQFADVDIYVGLDKFHEACNLLRTLPGGYNWGDEIDAGRHYNIEFGQYPMEVHRISSEVSDPKEASVYALIEQDGLVNNLRRMDFEGVELSIPSKEFMVFFTFYHAWHHFLTTGVGWRQISDVAITLHAYSRQMDLDKLNRWITKMHLKQPWQTFGYLAVECLGLPKEEMPFYDASCHRKAQRLYGLIMEGGNFRRNRCFKQNSHQRTILVRKTHSFIGIFVDFFYLAKVFPASAFSELKVAFRQGLKKNFQKK